MFGLSTGDQALKGLIHSQSSNCYRSEESRRLPSKGTKSGLIFSSLGRNGTTLKPVRRLTSLAEAYSAFPPPMNTVLGWKYALPMSSSKATNRSVNLERIVE